MHTQQMIAAHPDVRGSTNPDLIRCIEECLDCAQICTSCADACLADSMVAHLRQCIRVDLDCADICVATAFVAGRRTGSNENVILGQLAACENACMICADECRRHADAHEHCRICADACMRCAEACRRAAQSMGARH